MSETTQEIVTNVQKDVKDEISLEPVDSGVEGSGQNSPTTEPTTKNATETLSVASATVPRINHSQSTMGSQAGNGPDELVPAERVSTWLGNDAVKLRMTEKGPGMAPPVSVLTMFRNTVKKAPDNIAMREKPPGSSNWKTWTYRDYWEDVQRAAKSFIRLGVEPYHGVGIIGFNSPEWFISALGAIFCGAFSVGIYTTNAPDACHYVLENCEANVVVVEDEKQLAKIIEVKSRLPHLKAIVQYKGIPSDERYYSWDQFMKLGSTVKEELLIDRVRNMAPNKCCSLIYTSGTTGNPKGVMLSHDNITWTAKMATKAADLQYGEEVSISYLPLSHVAAQMLDIYVPMLLAGAVYFARADALKGSLSTTLREVRPTSFLGVPRVWEKIHERMLEVGKTITGFKRKMADWAKRTGLKGNLAKMNGGSTPFGWFLADRIAFQRVKLLLGLDRCKICITGAAPIARETLDYFMSVDLPLMELYGMSECSGPQTLSMPWSFRIGAVGKDFAGAETKIVEADKDANGEVCMLGRHVFMGYLNMEEKTNEAIDKDGLLHSGDIGRQDADGFLYITGRIKELIITAGGENVAPVPIEDIVKEELSIISNVMLIGDKRKFLSALLTLKVEVDADSGEPQDQLAGAALDFCAKLGSSAKTVDDVLGKKDDKVLRAVQAGIDRANKRMISRAQNIQKWSILPVDFSIPGGELGPTLKLKRPVVVKKYAQTIEAFYV